MSPRRVAIIGMNNPYSPDPRHALWPDPPNCTGWRLWKLTAARTGATQMDYVRAFHRYNLVERGMFDIDVAKKRWRDMEKDLLSDFDTVVLLGVAVRRATGIDVPSPLFSRAVVYLPHPSGLSRWYDSDMNRKIAEIAMEELFTGATTA